MRKTSPRTLTVIAGALGTLILTFPIQSNAEPYRSYDNEAWQGVQHEGEELDEARDAERQDRQQLRHEQREMDAARRAGDWRGYQHERQEAEQAGDAVREDQAQVAHEREELREQEHALRRQHHHDHED